MDWNPGKCDESGGHPVVCCNGVHRQLSQTVENGVIIWASDCCEKLFGAAKNTADFKNTTDLQISICVIQRSKR